MLITVFEYTNYKLFVDKKLTALGKNQRGYKQKAAEYIGCQPSYLSQVLNGKPHLTLEQAYKLNRFFHHDTMESRYFILLIEHSRAGTKELKDFFAEQLNELKQTRFDLKKRLQDTEQISTEAMNKYYSTWYYCAVHMALAVPEMQDVRLIAQRFHLSENTVADVIQFLESSGLIEKKNGRYLFTKMKIHLGRDSDFIQRHHINWRSQTLQSVEKNLAHDLHFSSVFALSKSDFETVKEIFINAIEFANKVIDTSDSQEVCAIALDVFRY